MERIAVQTDKHGVLDITGMVKKKVGESKVRNGLCCVFVPHTTAGIVIYSGVDPKGLLDLDETVRNLVPARVDFHHKCDPPTDAAGHIKSAIFGNSITLIIENGELVLGSSQYIFFYEFDGPRKREILVEVLGKEEHVLSDV